MTIREMCRDKMGYVLDDLDSYLVSYDWEGNFYLEKKSHLPKLDVFIDDFRNLVYFDSDGIEDWQNDLLEDEMRYAEEYITHEYAITRFDRCRYYFLKWKEKTYDKLVSGVRAFLCRCSNYLE